MSGASGGIKTLLALIDTLLNQMAEVGVLSGIKRFTDSVNELLTWLTQIDETGEPVNRTYLQMTTFTVGLVAALLPLGLALRVVSFALMPFWKLLLLTGGALKWLAIKTGIAEIAALAFGKSTGISAAGGLKKLAAGMKLAAAATLRFGLALLLNPIGLVVAAIALLAAGIAPSSSTGMTLERPCPESGTG